MTHYKIYYLNKITNVWSQSLITLEIKQFLKYLDLARNCIKKFASAWKFFIFGRKLEIRIGSPAEKKIKWAHKDILILTPDTMTMNNLVQKQSSEDNL